MRLSRSPFSRSGTAGEAEPGDGTGNGATIDVPAMKGNQPNPAPLSRIQSAPVPGAKSSASSNLSGRRLACGLKLCADVAAVRHYFYDGRELPGHSQGWQQAGAP